MSLDYLVVAAEMFIEKNVRGKEREALIKLIDHGEKVPISDGSTYVLITYGNTFYITEMGTISLQEQHPPSGLFVFYKDGNYNHYRGFYIDRIKTVAKKKTYPIAMVYYLPENNRIRPLTKGILFFNKRCYAILEETEFYSRGYIDCRI